MTSNYDDQNSSKSPQSGKGSLNSDAAPWPGKGKAARAENQERGLPSNVDAEAKFASSGKGEVKSLAASQAQTAGEENSHNNSQTLQSPHQNQSEAKETTELKSSQSVSKATQPAARRVRMHYPPGEHYRLCVSCRRMKPRTELIRLTADNLTGYVRINHEKPPLMGRSVYLCRSQTCLAQALKGNRLKGALEGRKGKNLANRRTVKWPFETQLIHDISCQCTEA